MFNVGLGEIGLVLIVALLVLGPQRLPEVAHLLGTFVRQFRKGIEQVRNEIATTESTIQSPKKPDSVSPHDAG